MLIYITQGIVLGLYGAAIPGPFQAFLLSETLRSGWKRTLPAALAPLISDGPVLLAFLLVLSRLPDFLSQPAAVWWWPVFAVPGVGHFSGIAF